MTLADASGLAVLVSLLLYVVLGGADFGGGFWEFFTVGKRGDRQRALIESAMAPVWEANHVWVILALVLAFTGFPGAFSRIATVLHIPLTLMLLGIVFRGSAFVFRQYGLLKEEEKGLWNRVFGVASTLTPIFLGVCIGAITNGGAADVELAPPEFILDWLSPFPLTVGLFALALFAFLAAVYLTNETAETDLQDDFRRRAFFSGTALLFCEALLAVTLEHDARFRVRFQHHPICWAIQTLGVASTFAAFYFLSTRKFGLARVAGITTAVAILAGWGYAQYPYVIGTVTLQEAAAPPETLRLLLGALALGAVVLLPSLYWLLRLFKSGSRIR